MSRTKQIKYDLFKQDHFCANFNYNDDPLKIKNLIVEWSIGYDSIMLELCAGYCEYSLDYAIKHPNVLCIAIDIKEDRLMFARRYASENNINNIRFLRTDISNLSTLFDNNVTLIYLVHPDPQVNNIRIRLNQVKYIEQYYNSLVIGGEFYLITDNTIFYNEFYENASSLELTKDRVQKKIDLFDSFNIIKTRYNQKFITRSNPTKILKIIK
jgi:tRNA G46 methylase TrmB